MFHLVVGFDYIYGKLDGVGGLLYRTNNVLSDWLPSFVRYRETALPAVPMHLTGFPAHKGVFAVDMARFCHHRNFTRSAPD